MSFGDPRRLILAGALTTAAGLAAAGTAPIVGIGAAAQIECQQTAGGVLVLLGWTVLAYGIHRFGRSS